MEMVNAQNHLVEETVQVKYKAIRVSSCRVLPQHFEHLLEMHEIQVFIKNADKAYNTPYPFFFHYLPAINI